MPSLTGVRAIAAGMVFFYHYFILTGHIDFWYTVPRAVVSGGALGVSVFFALSGFLITIRYYEDFDRRRITFKTYWLRRFFRIYPLYWFVLTFFVVVPQWLSGKPFDPRVLVINYTLTQALFTDAVLSGTVTAWTLTLEEIFYVLAPWLMKRLAPTLGIGRGALFARAVLIIAVAEALGYGVTLLPAVFPDTIIGAPHWYIREFSIFGRLSDFVAGMVCAVLWLQARRAQIPAGRANALIVLGILGVLTPMVISYAVSPNDLTVERHVLHAAVGIFSAVLILGLAWDRANASVVTRAFGSPVMEYLGKISYALYLVQLTPVAIYLQSRVFDPWMLPSTRTAVMYLVISLISIALYECIEQPIHRWVVRRLRHEPRLQPS